MVLQFSFPALSLTIPALIALSLAGCSTQSSQKVDSPLADAKTEAQAPVNSTEVLPALAATVNGESISIQQLKTLSLGMAGKAAFDQLVDEALINQAAKTRAVTVTKQEIEAKKTEMQATSGGSLEENLKQNGLSMAAFEEGLSYQIKLEKLVATPINPARNMRRVWHLTIATLDVDEKTGKFKTRSDKAAIQLIGDLQKKLKAGANFSELAARQSDYVATREAKGEVGILYEGVTYASHLYPVARKLKVGEHSKQLFKSSAGYEIVYVSSTADNHPASENELYARADKNYRQEQLADAGIEILKSLRKAAQIAVYDNRFAPTKSVHLIAQDKAAPTVATVNGQNISLAAVEARALRMSGANGLQQLIRSAVIAQAARSKNISVTKADLNSKKAVLLVRLKGQSLDQALKQRNLTMQRLESELTEQIKLEKFANVAPKKLTRMRHVYHIAIAAQDAGPVPLPGSPQRPSKAAALAKLAMIRSRLKAGEKFEDLARQYSDDVMSKKQGGDLGIMHDDTPVNHDILKVALSLKKGEYSAPFKSFFGYELVYIASTEADHAPSEAALYATEKKQFQEMRSATPIEETLQSLQEKADISVYFQA